MPNIAQKVGGDDKDDNKHKKFTFNLKKEGEDHHNTSNTFSSNYSKNSEDET